MFPDIAKGSLVEQNHPQLRTTALGWSAFGKGWNCSDFTLVLALVSIITLSYNNHYAFPDKYISHKIFILFIFEDFFYFVLQRTVRLCEQLSTVIPNSHVYYRRGLALKRIIPQCISRDFTDLIVINEDRKTPSILCFLRQGFYFAWLMLEISSNINFCTAVNKFEFCSLLLTQTTFSRNVLERIQALI